MNRTERELILRLFEKIGQASMQPAPRDGEAEQLINKQMREIPGAAYYMAQTLVVQRQALKQAEARIAQLEQQLGVQPGGYGSSLAPQQGYGQSQFYNQSQPQYYDNRGSFGGGGGFGGDGFLAGAAQTALGVAGGVLLANAAFSLFDGLDSAAGDLFSDTPVDTFASAAPDFGPEGESGSAGGSEGESGSFLDGGDFGSGDEW